MIIIALVCGTFTFLTASCIRPLHANEITRDRAIEIARTQVSFQPDSINAVRTISNARPLWRVTVRGRLPGQPALLFETIIVEIDGLSGAVMSVART